MVPHMLIRHVWLLLFCWTLVQALSGSIGLPFGNTNGNSYNLAGSSAQTTGSNEGDDVSSNIVTSSTAYTSADPSTSNQATPSTSNDNTQNNQDGSSTFDSGPSGSSPVLSRITSSIGGTGNTPFPSSTGDYLHASYGGNSVLNSPESSGSSYVSKTSNSISGPTPKHQLASSNGFNSDSAGSSETSASLPHTDSLSGGEFTTQDDRSQQSGSSSGSASATQSQQIVLPHQVVHYRLVVPHPVILHLLAIPNNPLV
ncbi:hypothetical protein ZYGR_0N05300 [Zygosaccharomyces rouxii]|uniref:Uncharacterized protein n=1 Tax=Zygosaccharomyces rouxii TaxID=4956 RepID=A0A1Q3A0A7_ZYGRO|nr:hypothetical protein ZYGR_0N05300 [Zygosaccharomyces rouxii]